MHIDCGINYYSPELDGGQGVYHHCTSCFSDCIDHEFVNTMVMVSVGRACLVCCSSSREDILEGLMVIFSWFVITPELVHLVSH